MLYTPRVFSVVVPLRDEAANVRPLVEEIHRVLSRYRFELICVDDGSQDATRSVLEDLSPGFPNLRILRHDSGYGQSAALATGVRAARTAWVVTMDGDGQNDPSDIPRLFDALHQSPPPTMVVGWRRRRNDPWLKRVSSRLANLAYRWVLGDATPDVGCGLKLFRREDFLELPYFDHMHRFLPALMVGRGGRVASVEVNHRPRQSGSSKYGVHDRLWVGIVDLLGVRWLNRRGGLHVPVSEPVESARNDWPSDAERHRVSLSAKSQ